MVVITKYENIAFKYKRSGADNPLNIKGHTKLYWCQELSVKLFYPSSLFIRDKIVSCWTRSKTVLHAIQQRRGHVSNVLEDYAQISQWTEWSVFIVSSRGKFYLNFIGHLQRSGKGEKLGYTATPINTSFTNMSVDGRVV